MTALLKSLSTYSFIFAIANAAAIATTTTAGSGAGAGGQAAGAATTTSTTSSSTSSSTCNPLSATCSANPALATAYAEDFTTNSSYFETYHYGERISYTDEGLKLTIAERYDNPSLVSKEYIMFGKMEAIVKTANGTGIISTIYLQSDVEDEIDWEWFGGDGTEVATDFFREGNTTTYDRGTYYEMSGDPRTSYHNYTIDWTEEAITWYVDGEVARTLSNDSSQGYPQTPCRIFIGLWAGGDASNSEGTIEWAGGSTDYDDAPFYMHVKELVVTDYSTGDSYSYGDESGDLDSISADDGTIYGRYSKGVQEWNELVSGEDTDDDDDEDEDDSSSSSSSTKKSSSSSSTKKSSSTKTTSSDSSASATESGSGKTSSLAAEAKTTTTSKSSSSSSSSSGDSSTTATATTATGAAAAGYAQSTTPLLTLLSAVPAMLLALL